MTSIITLAIDVLVYFVNYICDLIYEKPHNLYKSSNLVQKIYFTKTHSKLTEAIT